MDSDRALPVRSSKPSKDPAGDSNAPSDNGGTTWMLLPVEVDCLDFSGEAGVSDYTDNINLYTIRQGPNQTISDDSQPSRSKACLFIGRYKKQSRSL
jgi:hypothetical protein